ncbi:MULTISPECIES: alpha/beta fold hydrolase [Acinetobacter]|uniref:Alpha/beta fold hydrolase n=1 Tax=Acinetobacter entericus TaxID=2989714 RepID=A0ABT3NNB4_9GAMM|nr:MULTISPECIES: alpha/beta fold hydrolase [Acinetobacter]MCW8040410.1 alpha/beta fold hydrolase [Acinetobacter entericus]TCB76144.1 alpha/beta fold hydrolase [Acinetobacter sp. ANC 4177]
MSQFEALNITCKDGYRLSARFYAAQTKQHEYPVLICPATGITKQFYNNFASWLSEQGYDVLVFDFRGIGDSLHGPLSKSTASIVQWGQLDIPAAVDTLLQKASAAQVILLGHSAGGQLLGIVPNYEKVAKVVAVSGSTGHVKGLKGRTKILAPLMFKGIFPIARYTLGYGPTNAIGMGENLPKDVAREWAQFCSKPGYVMNAIGKTVHKDFHHEIQAPITALWSSDDEIATRANVKDLLRMYPNASTAMIELKPSEYGHKGIGHMLMFKKSHQNLWPVIKQQLAV